jgi:hypothetical protein
MNKTKLAVATAWVAATLLAANAAWAAADPAPPAPTPAPIQVTGKIHAIDVVNLVIKMEGGQYYVVPSSIKLTDFKEGDQIVLSGEKDSLGGLQVKSVTKK